MKHSIFAFFLLALSLGVRLQAQPLWNGTSYGMSKQQVQQLFTTAHTVRNEDGKQFFILDGLTIAAHVSVGIPKPSTDGHVKTGHAGDSRQMRREGLADKVFVGRGGVEERGRAATRKCGGGLGPLSSTSLGVRVGAILGFVL